MIVYNDCDSFQKDINWLAQECSLPYFATSRLSKLKHHQFIEKLQNETTFDPSFVKSYYDNFFKAYNLVTPKWTTILVDESLPLFAIIPHIGVCIILGKASNGWKCDSVEGVVYHNTFPEETLFTPIREERIAEKQNTAYAMFKSIALKQKRTILTAAIATFSVSFLALGTSFYSMQVYDRVIPTHGISTLIALSVGVFIAIFLEMLLKIARSIVMDHASIIMDKRYSFNIFNRFLMIRLDAFPSSIGSLSGQLQSYATVRSFISTAALFFTTDLPFAFFFIGIITLIGGINMGIIPLVFFFLSLSTAFFFKNKIEILTKQSVAASNKKLGLLVESVEKAEILKASGHGFAVSNRWNALTEDALNDDMAIKHYSEFSSHMASFLQQLSYILLVGVGAYLASTTDKLTMGGLIAISILSGRALTPLASLPNIFVQWARAKMSLSDLDRIYALPLDNEGIDRPLTPAILNPSYLCRNVKFSYSQESRPISIENLNIKAGEKVAILGAIGSGKSTILKILAALYAPHEGDILLDGIDITKIARDRLSSIIGYLPQDIKLVSGTLLDNLTLVFV
jgi:ATP-binding cassette subfamily C protein LapB